jgi:hypothetical protein
MHHHSMLEMAVAWYMALLLEIVKRDRFLIYQKNKLPDATDMRCEMRKVVSNYTKFCSE